MLRGSVSSAWAEWEAASLSISVGGNHHLPKSVEKLDVPLQRTVLRCGGGVDRLMPVLIEPPTLSLGLLDDAIMVAGGFVIGLQGHQHFLAEALFKPGFIRYRLLLIHWAGCAVSHQEANIV